MNSQMPKGIASIARLSEWFYKKTERVRYKLNNNKFNKVAFWGPTGRSINPENYWAYWVLWGLLMITLLAVGATMGLINFLNR